MSSTARSRPSGPGRVLVAVYGILALAATGRSVYQILTRFDEAPIAYSLSALAGVVYIVATVALVVPSSRWTRIAWATIGFELIGVLLVGTISLAAPQLLGLENASPVGGQATVWSAYGAGYLFVPLVLPVLGLLWLRRTTRAEPAPVP